MTAIITKRITKSKKNLQNARSCNIQIEWVNNCRQQEWLEKNFELYIYLIRVNYKINMYFKVIIKKYCWVFHYFNPRDKFNNHKKFQTDFIQILEYNPQLRSTNNQGLLFPISFVWLNENILSYWCVTIVSEFFVYELKAMN